MITNTNIYMPWSRAGRSTVRIEPCDSVQSYQNQGLSNLLSILNLVTAYRVIRIKV